MQRDGADDRSDDRPGWAAHTAPLAVGVVLALYLGLALHSADRKSVTVDELGHLPSGFYLLRTGDARYATLNPPLVNALSALPVLWLDLEVPPDPPVASDDVMTFWSNGYHFHERHRSDYQRIYRVARWVPIVLVAVLGGLLYTFARRLVPAAVGGSAALAGVLAAGWLCLSPNVIAHARLIGTDTGTALFTTIAVWTLRDAIRRPGAATSTRFGVALGLAQLTKFYALLLYPIAIGVALVWHLLAPRSSEADEPEPGPARVAVSLAAATAISGFVIAAGYGFQELGASLSDQSLRSPALQAWQGTLLGELPLPVPGAYLRAFDGQLSEVASTIPTYLLGETFRGGRPDYFVVLLGLKTPIALGAAVGLALLLSFRRLGGSPLPAREVVWLLAYPVSLFAVLSLSPGRQLGLRALLSAAPLVWLWAAASVGRSASRRWVRYAAIATLVGTAAASISTHPHYIPYFNEIAGGTDEGYRYASEGNVDIGQDLPGLAAYLRENGVGRVQLLYFGSVDPGLYGIDYAIPGAQLAPGLLAVSVTLYRTGYLMYQGGQLHDVGPVEVQLGEPIARIGGSIHVYRVE